MTWLEGRRGLDVDDKRPDCYKCIHRGVLPGDAHSKCCHPEATRGLDSNNIAAMAEAYRGKATAGQRKLGIRGGGQTWPANFNPSFLTNCEGFEAQGGDGDS